VYLDIRGAFDSVWWNGLLQHLWSVGLRGRVYKLMCSYLSNRTLFVVAHGDTSSRGHLQLAFLRVASGPLSCLTCIQVTFQLKFSIVICLCMLTIQPLLR